MQVIAAANRRRLGANHSTANEEQSAPKLRYWKGPTCVEEEAIVSGSNSHANEQG